MLQASSGASRVLCTITRGASRWDPLLPPHPYSMHLSTAVPLALAWPRSCGMQSPGLHSPFLSTVAPRDRWELSTMAGIRYSNDGI